LTINRKASKVKKGNDTEKMLNLHILAGCRLTLKNREKRQPIKCTNYPIYSKGRCNVETSKNKVKTPKTTSSYTSKKTKTRQFSNKMGPRKVKGVWKVAKPRNSRKNVKIFTPDEIADMQQVGKLPYFNSQHSEIRPNRPINDIR